MSESIGSTLKQRREARHLSIEQVAEQTRVRTHYLKALENDDLSAIPSMVQARGFLRIYAEFLGLNLDELTSLTPSVESKEPIQVPASTPEPLAAPVQLSAPASDVQPRPSFFGGLRDRFTRRPSAEVVSPEPEPVVPQPEPEVFVPVRVHEELPAAPEEPIASEPEPVVKPVRARKTVSRNASTKKPVRAKSKTNAIKETKSIGAKARVKKKIVSSRKMSLSKKQLRPKRTSSPRK